MLVIIIIFIIVANRFYALRKVTKCIVKPLEIMAQEKLNVRIFCLYGNRG